MKLIKFNITLLTFLVPSFCTIAAGLSLLDRNPFIWPGFDNDKTAEQVNEQPPASSGDYEFHAVYELSGRTQVLVYDRKNNTYHWLEVGREAEGMLAKSFDPDSNQLVLTDQTDEQFLELKQRPDVTSAPLANTVRPSPRPSRPRTTTTPTRRIVRPSANTSVSRNRSSSVRRSGPLPASAERPRISRRSNDDQQVQASERDLKRFREFDVPRPRSTEAPELGDLKPPDVDLPKGIER